jgi:hypothetical protein
MVIQGVVDRYTREKVGNEQWEKLLTIKDDTLRKLSRSPERFHWDFISPNTGMTESGKMGFLFGFRVCTFPSSDSSSVGKNQFFIGVGNQESGEYSIYDFQANYNSNDEIRFPFFTGSSTKKFGGNYKHSSMLFRGRIRGELDKIPVYTMPLEKKTLENFFGIERVIIPGVAKNVFLTCTEESVLEEGMRDVKELTYSNYCNALVLGSTFNGSKNVLSGDYAFVKDKK